MVWTPETVGQNTPLNKFIAWGCFGHRDRKEAHGVTVTVIISALILIQEEMTIPTPRNPVQD